MLGMCYQVRFFTSDGMVRMFNEERENMLDEARSGRLSSVNDDLVHKVDERVHDDKCFTISDLSLHFPQISMTLSVVANIAGSLIL